MAKAFSIGTRGYSFEDWVAMFYPPGTDRKGMFAHSVRNFHTVELNFTDDRMPRARTLSALADKSPAGFDCALFNNCHRGQTAENAQAFQRIVADLKIPESPEDSAT